MILLSHDDREESRHSSESTEYIITRPQEKNKTTSASTYSSAVESESENENERERASKVHFMSFHNRDGKRGREKKKTAQCR